jgi:hypothetical protein
LGGLNGIEAGRRIRQWMMKIVILTLNKGREYQELARSVELDGFIKTDFTSVICSVIEAL